MTIYSKKNLFFIMLILGQVTFAADSSYSNVCERSVASKGGGSKTPVVAIPVGSTPVPSNNYHDKKWNAKFELLKKFVEKKGHARIPLKLDSKEYLRLGSWVKIQREAYRNMKAPEEGRTLRTSNRITPERISKLEELGFEWGASPSNRWNAKFELLKKFVENHGHARVPRKLDLAKYPKLGSWVVTQRAAYRNKIILEGGGTLKRSRRITPEKIKKLEELGFEWSVPKKRRNRSSLLKAKRTR